MESACSPKTVFNPAGSLVLTLMLSENIIFILMFLQEKSVLARMGNECTLKIMWLCLCLVLWSQCARPASLQSPGYDEFLQRIRDGHVPSVANHSSPDWVYKSQSSAFEEALKKGKNVMNVAF